MSDTQEIARNVLRLAMLDPMIRTLNEFYQGPDVEDGPLCLALVIEQALPRFGITGVTSDDLAAAIGAEWGRS